MIRSYQDRALYSVYFWNKINYRLMKELLDRNNRLPHYSWGLRVMGLHVWLSEYMETGGVVDRTLLVQMTHGTHVRYSDHPTRWISGLNNSPGQSATCHTDHLVVLSYRVHSPHGRGHTWVRDTTREIIARSLARFPAAGTSLSLTWIASY